LAASGLRQGPRPSIFAEESGDLHSRHSLGQGATDAALVVADVGWVLRGDAKFLRHDARAAPVLKSVLAQSVAQSFLVSLYGRATGNVDPRQRLDRFNFHQDILQAGEFAARWNLLLN
jgi:hypothetical protein